MLAATAKRWLRSGRSVAAKAAPTAATGSAPRPAGRGRRRNNCVGAVLPSRTTNTRPTVPDRAERGGASHPHRPVSLRGRCTASFPRRRWRYCPASSHPQPLSKVPHHRERAWPPSEIGYDTLYAYLNFCDSVPYTCNIGTTGDGRMVTDTASHSAAATGGSQTRARCR